jgi:hypothetical protein
MIYKEFIAHTQQDRIQMSILKTLDEILVALNEKNNAISETILKQNVVEPNIEIDIEEDVKSTKQKSKKRGGRNV